MGPRERIDRRRVVLGGLGLIGGLGLGGGRSSIARSLLAAPRACAAPRTLVLLQLSGGNDGLSMVVPHGDDAYHRLRPTIRHRAEDVLRLDERRGLHPALAGLRRHFDAGRVALVEGAGYPDPNRSHFRSMDIWQAADPRGRDLPEGWVGRLMGAVHGTEADPSRVIHLGATVPYALFSTRHPPASFLRPEGYRWIRNAERIRELEERLRPGPAESPGLELVRRVMRAAGESSSAVLGAVERYRPTVDYPRTDLADDLCVAAALVHGDLGCRVVSLELSGFDTHNDQRRRHDQLMQTLDEGLAAFLDDLGASEVGRSTVVLAFSEFGRRVAENGSQGTDHGTAGPVLVAGHGVRGGFHGRSPALDELADGDLVHTTDFRAVYAALIRGCFGVDPEPVLGGRFEGLELL